MMAYVVCQEFIYMYIEWYFYFCNYMVHVFMAIKILIAIIVELHAFPNHARAEPYT